MVSRVVPHDKLMEAAEEMASKILRNDQWAVRSAKETILNVIGRPLDDQLAYEAFTGYSGASNPTVSKLLSNFADKTDKGRVGKNKTDL
jgi:enoyl-CoA hydratase/carnithine racemase